MDVGQVLLALLLLVGYPYWLYQLVTLVRVSRRVPVLEDLPEEAREPWPRVSVIMTARNEEAALEQAMQARLLDDYPHLELVLVQDRSTDRTPQIADRLAAADSRVKVVHISTLPEGWLGKLNALQQGLDAATGEWLLFSDADVSVHRGVLRRIVSYCERRGIDHCTVLPSFHGVNPLLDSLTSVFLRLIGLNCRIWAIEDPRSRASVGAGAFNFVRRAALAKTKGFAWLKMEVADDLALGQMLKAAGAQQSIVNGRGMTGLVFHRSLGDALRSAARGTYTAAGNFSLAKLVAMGVALPALELSPLAALAASRSPATIGASAVLLLVAVGAMLVANRWLARPAWHVLLEPLGALLSGYSCVRSGVLGKWRGGIVWRGNFYPEAALKAGKRVQL